jgi:hypothetical protein
MFAQAQRVSLERCSIPVMIVLTILNGTFSTIVVHDLSVYVPVAVLAACLLTLSRALHVYTCTIPNNRASSASFCQGLGTSSDSLFKFSVQIFTTPSLVQAVDNDLQTAAGTSVVTANSTNSSSSSSSTRGVHALLVQCLVDCFAVAGARTDSSSSVSSSSSSSAEDNAAAAAAAAADKNAFLDHTVTTFRRFAHIFGDLEYALASPGAPPPDAAATGITPNILCYCLICIASTAYRIFTCTATV